MPAIRYQVMAMEEELPGPVTVTAVSWMRSYEGDDRAVEYQFSMYMGLRQDDDLGAEFEANFIPGTRELVFYSDSLFLTGQARDWLTVPLQEPFHYPGTGNLVIELSRQDASSSNLFSFRWYTENDRTLLAIRHDAAYGYVDDVAAMLRIDYVPTGLSRTTWPGIKSIYLVR